MWSEKAHEHRAAVEVDGTLRRAPERAIHALMSAAPARDRRVERHAARRSIGVLRVLLAPREKDAILITGYQDEESPGAALLKLVANEGPRQLKLGDQTVDVRCRFSSYSLSAHADRMQMVELIEALSPLTVVLVHGDRAAKEALASSLGVDDIQLAADGDQIARTYNKALVPAPDAILDEASAEARALKADNPKGRLLELCARRRLPTPEVIHTESGEAHAVELRLDTPEGTVRASSKQMAARLLLEALRGSEETAWPMTDAQEELKQQNPKGRLLEAAGIAEGSGSHRAQSRSL